MAHVLRLQGEKKRKRRKTVLTLISIIVVIVLGMLYFFIASPKLHIQSIRAEGARTISSGDIIKVAEEALKPKRYGFVPGNHMVLFNAVFLEEKLREAFPRINTIFFGREVPNGLLISITERHAFAVWCRDYGVDCLFVDSAGIAYAEAPSFSDPVFVEYVGDAPMVNKAYAENKEFADTSDFVKKLKNEGITIHVIAKQEDGSYAAFLDRPEIDAALPPRIIFGGPGSDMSKSFDRFIIAWRESPLQGKPIAELGLEYIDVRFGNKVFYKKQQ